MESLSAEHDIALCLTWSSAVSIELCANALIETELMEMKSSDKDAVERLGAVDGLGSLIAESNDDT